jgi:hypothetical protein
MLSVLPISNWDVQNAVKRQGPSKSVGLDGKPSVATKGYSKICVLFLKFIFNLGLSENAFSQLVEASSGCPYFQRKKKQTHSYS